MVEEIWQNLINISPQIFWAILVFVIGWLIAKWIGKLVAAFLNRIRLNQVFKRMGWEDAFEKIHPRLSATGFFGQIVRWFFVILVLWAASQIIGFFQLSQLLEKVIVYYPNIFVAAFIFIVAVFLADFSQKIVVGTLEKEKIIYSQFLGRTIRWIIWLFAALAILYQLKITPNLILAIFIGIVAIIAIAAGIAFGLGGKDIAAKILKELEEKFK